MLSKLPSPNPPTLSSVLAPRESLSLHMGAPSDDIVLIRLGQNQGDPSVITINCPDQLGLGCDLARVLFEFGLTVVRGDLSTDGRWCFVIFWVMPRSSAARPIKWAMLKKRLVSTCPSSRASLLLPLIPQPKQQEVYLLQVCSPDRLGLLNEMAQTMWELELTIHKVKATTSPDGKAVDMFYITNVRDLRQEDVCSRVRDVVGDNAFCELRLAGPEWGGLDCASTSTLPASMMEDLFCEGLAELESDLRSMGGHGAFLQKASVTLDNTLSPGHTLLQISSKDRKGLLYDCMRVLKDFNIQVAYGRLSTTPKGTGEIDLFVLQADGKQILDPQKQKTLCYRLEMEIVNPIRVIVVSKGPDSELVIATPIEISGRGRPRVLHDATAALKMLDICIFKADIGRHMIGDRQWEIYRLLLIEKPELPLVSSKARSHIVERVRNSLMG